MNNKRVIRVLIAKVGCDIHVISGGLLSHEDVKALNEMGVSGNYGPGTPVDLIIDHIRNLVAK